MSRQQVKTHIRPATCSVWQAGVPTSRPPSGKANTKNTANAHGVVPRDSPEGSSCWRGPPYSRTGRERCAVQTHTEVHQYLGLLPFRGDLARLHGCSISSRAPSRIPERCCSWRGCPVPLGVTVPRPRPWEEPVSLPLLGAPTPMSWRWMQHGRSSGCKLGAWG